MKKMHKLSNKKSSTRGAETYHKIRNFAPQTMKSVWEKKFKVETWTWKIHSESEDKKCDMNYFKRQKVALC